MSAPSDELVVEIPGDVPDPVSDIMYCIRKTSDDDQLVLQWTCPVSLTNPSITPPITHYTAVMGNSLLCPSVIESNCSSSTDYCPIDVSDGQMITANITAVNPVGPSTARSVAINVDLELLSITVINVISDSVAIQCSTSYQSSANRYCSVNITSPAVISGHSMFEGTDADVTFNNLMSGTTHMFTASLVNDSNQPFPSACITVEDSFTVESITPIMPSSSSMIISPSDTSVTTSTGRASQLVPTTIMPAAGVSGGAIGGAIAAGVVIVIIAIVIIVLVTVYVYKRAKNGSIKRKAEQQDTSSGSTVKTQENVAYSNIFASNGTALSLSATTRSSATVEVHVLNTSANIAYGHVTTAAVPAVYETVH